ncbi:hypothetical protein Spb1_17750 [Planctopirus ephydatiae]|uniref:Uncharacterized protein n=1 Tax=Planctopirus ephydatiae TaxID=2528019 RepID=A0A518GMS0_9PLAN|nr:hypothetical protein Spb1_17750 [Planctopirus ephydatiae]
MLAVCGARYVAVRTWCIGMHPTHEDVAGGGRNMIRIATQLPLKKLILIYATVIEQLYANRSPSVVVLDELSQKIWVERC